MGLLILYIISPKTLKVTYILEKLYCSRYLWEIYIAISGGYLLTESGQVRYKVLIGLI
jgi:hypothetical protein